MDNPGRIRHLLIGEPTAGADDRSLAVSADPLATSIGPGPVHA